VKAAGEILFGIVLGLALGGAVILGVMKLGDFIVRVFP
jgi:hypothetical protein